MRSDYVREASGDESDPDASDVAAAYRSGLRSLTAHESSRSNLATKLRRKGYSASGVEEAVSRLEAEGWLNDTRFAVMFLRYRIRSKPAPLFVLRRELRQKGCDEETVETALQRIEDEEDTSDEAMALRAVQRKRSLLQRNPDRLLRHLARLGFSASTARTAMEEVTAEENSP